MPLSSLLGLAAASHGASALWRYNRENYMFDIPVRQAGEYQVQNIMMIRFGLFREDVRDLARLTTKKVQSYLIVNTLQLGFIVATYTNFDRTDKEREESDFEEIQIDILFSMLLLTGFFWLLTSILFSIYALIITQCLTAKVLIRVARIPLPTADEIYEAATEYKNFERDRGQAFRLPLISRTAADPLQPPCEDERGPCGPAGHVAPAGKGAPHLRVHDVDAPISIRELLYESEDNVDEESLGRQGMEPHLKLLMLLKASWEAFDFYSKVCMQLGTATMLGGLGFLGLYYLRVTGATFEVESGGWICFLFFSLLAWASLVFELSISLRGQFLVGTSMMSGPTMMLAGYDRDRMHWMLPVIMLLTALWVLVACWAGVSDGSYWPRIWAAGLWMNVLHAETGPPQPHKDLPVRLEDIGFNSGHRGSRMVGPHPPPMWRGGTVESDDSTATSVASMLSGGGSTCDFDEEWRLVNLSLTMMMLSSLEAVRRLPLKEQSRWKVTKAHDNLRQGAHAVGAFSRCRMRTRRPLEGFWLQIPAEKTEWIDPDGCGDPEDSHKMSLDDLIRGANQMAETLFKDACTWNLRDMQEMVQYGGEPVLGVASFTAQFRRTGTWAKKSIGHSAFGFYLGGVVIVTLMWIFALVLSFSAAYYRPGRTGILISELQERAAVPLPWLVPRGYACDDTCRKIVVTDFSAGIFLATWSGPHMEVQSNVTWAGPFAVCGDSSVLGADIGPDNQTWALCPDKGFRRFKANLATGDLELEPFAEGGATGLTAMALDAAPPPGYVGALGLQDNELLGLRYDDKLGGRWIPTGTFIQPRGMNWTQMGLLRGRGMLIDSVNQLWTINVTNGDWDGPLDLPYGYSWHGLCEMPGGTDLMVWGQRQRNTKNQPPQPVEMLSFKWASLSEVSRTDMFSRFMETISPSAATL